MGIDLDNESIIALYKAGKYIPGPRKPSRATVFRYWLSGLRVQGSSERVRLETLKLNGIRCTSIEAIGRFLRIANGQAAIPAITATQRQKQAEAANKLLADAGL